MGKARKERATPLRAHSRKALRAWLIQIGAEPNDPVVATIRGRPLSQDAVERIVRKHAATAASNCSTFRLKPVTPYVLRHTAAIQLLQRDVDPATISLWLGHGSIEKTQVYTHADMEVTERATASIKPVGQTPGRYPPGDELLAFLEAL